MNKQIGIGLTFLVALLAAYWPGFQGPFLFDDFPNLGVIAEVGGIKDTLSFIGFVGEGVSSPLGRPIALLTFLLNSTEWPAAPRPFKVTNFAIHIANGILLWNVASRILQNYADLRVRDSRHTIAGLITVLWLCHPMQVSTVLYVIQRMALLSTFFTLLGIYFYLIGRRRLAENPYSGYAIISLVVPLCGGLALLSKENGVLLPIFLMSLEYTVIRSTAARSSAPSVIWQVVFLWVPLGILSAYAVHHVALTGSVPDVNRGFTLNERLLTEPRILLEYLEHILIPQIYGPGLFNDDYVMSKGLFDPPSTILCLLVVISMIGCGIAFRHRAPTYSAAVLFYFSGHLLESSFMQLDAYYEHRNYLPSLFLFLPVAELWKLDAKRQRIGVAMTLSFGLLLLSFSAMRAQLWGNHLALVTYWSKVHPNSVRAQRWYSLALFEVGDTRGAAQALKQTVEQNPNDLTLRLQFDAIRCGNGELSLSDLNELSDRLKRNLVIVDTRVNSHFSAFIDLVGKGACGPVRPRDLQPVVQAWMDAADAYPGSIAWRFVLKHYQGTLYALEGQGAEALAAYQLGIQENRDIEMILLETAILASHHLFSGALKLLEVAESMSATPQPPGRLGFFSTAIRDYPTEISRLKRQIHEDLEQCGASCQIR